MRKQSALRWRGARGSNMAFWRDDLDRGSVIDLALAALFQAADEDSATGGPDLIRKIFPVVATITAGSGESKAIKKGDVVEGFGTVFEIRRNRICFEKTDGFLGFVDIPEERVSFGQIGRAHV